MRNGDLRISVYLIVVGGGVGGVAKSHKHIFV